MIKLPSASANESTDIYISFGEKEDAFAEATHALRLKLDNAGLALPPSHLEEYVNQWNQLTVDTQNELLAIVGTVDQMKKLQERPLYDPAINAAHWPPPPTTTTPFPPPPPKD